MNDQQLDLLLRAADPGVALLDAPPPPDVLDDILAGRHVGPGDDQLRLPAPGADQPDPESAVVVPLRRRRRAIALVAAAALVLGVAGFVLISSRDPDTVDQVACYDEPSTMADAVILRATGLEDAVDRCRQVWQSGDMVDGVPDPRPVPDLVPCVLDTGAVGVFPATSCDDIERGASDSQPPLPDPRSSSSEAAINGTTPPDVGLPMPDLVPDDAELADVLEALRVALLETCVPGDEAADMVRTQMEDSGHPDWTVEVVGTHEPGTCAAFAPDIPNQRINLAPAPR